ncbi:hypothetical protein FISHEDRAFT_71397 [Fistulina hepatica ATCC 64428]|nr:hypothetical protein FISHEDRAFT_71397 [Fistulina hepatica ATCC 64428]
MDNPAPATIVLVSGDRDFSYVVAILRQRRYYVVVISPRPPSVTHSLRWQASELIEWDTIAPPLQPSTPPTLASQPGGVFPEIDPVKPHSSSPQMPPHVTPPQPSSPTAPSEPVSGSFAEATPHKTDWNVFDDEWTSSPLAMPSELLGPSEIERPSIPQMPEVFSSELDDNTPCSPELSSSDIGSEPDESDATTSSTDGTDRASSTETRTADVPVQFQSLVQLLNRLRSKNVHRPYRSIVSLKLYAMDNMVYRVAGVRSFKPFADMARASGVVTLGGKDGRAWISLEPRYWSQDTNL